MTQQYDDPTSADYDREMSREQTDELAARLVRWVAVIDNRVAEFISHAAGFEPEFYVHATYQYWLRELSDAILNDLEDTDWHRAIRAHYEVVDEYV